MARGSSNQATSTAGWLMGGCAVLLITAIVIFSSKLLSLWSQGLGTNSGKEVTVPNVVGLHQDEAERRLREAGLRSEIGQSEFTSDIEKDLVFQQRPEQGTTVRPNRKIFLYLSLGRAQFIVPDLQGLKLAALPEVLDKAGLQLGAVQKIYYPRAPAGSVLNQNPEPGREVQSSIAVDVIIADDASLPDVSMPNLIGGPLGGAEQQLADPQLNLHLALVEWVLPSAGPDGTLPAGGTVLSQNVPAGQPVKMGSRIELTATLPAEQATAAVRSLTLRIPVPLGPPQQEVKIKVYDKLGSQVVYDAQHKPGDLVERRIDLEGAGKVQVFIDDQKRPWREERLP